MSENDDPPVKLRDMPLPIRMAMDLFLLRSTVPTAIAYAILWFGVIVHVLWVCSFFDRYGFESPITTENNRLTWLIANDIRYYGNVLCRLPDGIQREQVVDHLDRLQVEFQAITPSTAHMPEVACPSSRVLEH